jgi:hypothetical protein
VERFDRDQGALSRFRSMFSAFFRPFNAGNGRVQVGAVAHAVVPARSYSEEKDDVSQERAFNIDRISAVDQRPGSVLAQGTDLPMTSGPD